MEFGAVAHINPHVREVPQEECQARLREPGWDKSGEYPELRGMTVYANRKSGELLLIDEELQICVVWSSAERLEDAIGGAGPGKIFGATLEDLPHTAGLEATRLVEKARAYGVDLDFTRMSLARLDEILGEVAVDDCVVPEMFFPLAFYVGETIIKTHGGRWFRNKIRNHDEPWIELDDGRILDVTGLVFETLSQFPENLFGLESGGRRLLES
jgi:hypothetical protein